MFTFLSAFIVFHLLNNWEMPIDVWVYVVRTYFHLLSNDEVHPLPSCSHSHTTFYMHNLILTKVILFFQQLNRKVFLGLYDSRTWPEPDSRDEQRVRDYMVQKYENKRWYVAPTEAMKEEAKRINEAALNSKPQVKPLRSLLGENASKLTVGAAPVSFSLLILKQI